MKWLSTRQNGIAVASIVGIVVALGFVLTFDMSPASGAKAPPPAGPLQLSSVPIPVETLAAAVPSNVFYTVTSSNGPFCLEGFFVIPNAPAFAQYATGGVMIHLSRIDTVGDSHQYFTIVDGSTTGVSLLDIVLSYGNHICANGSLQFQATQYPGQAGTGIDIQLWGRAMVLAPPGNTITITGATQE